MQLRSLFISSFNMKKFLQNTGLFISPFLLGIVVLFTIPLDKQFVYHFVKGECNNKASWIYNRVYENKKQIDIVFSGASQTSCAIMDEYLQQEIRKNENIRLNVANLGYCRRGRDIQYIMLKDLFQKKQPDFIFIEVAEDEPKKSHPVFPYLASASDLFDSFTWFNQRFFTAVWKGIAVRFEQFKSRLFEKNKKYRGLNSDFGYIHDKTIVSENMLDKNTRHWERRLRKKKPTAYRKSELNYSKKYLQKMVDLAAANNCRLYFIYFPEYGSRLKEPLLSDYYRSKADLLILPDSLVSDKNNWKDAMHFNDYGAKKATHFVGTFISEKLTATR